MRLRFGIILFVFLGIPALFFGLTAAFFIVGGLFEKLFSGGHQIANILTLMLTMVMVFATVLTLAERKWSAMMQDRVGPSRADLPIPAAFREAGVGHMAADALKMLTKEDFIPAAANRAMFIAAPAIHFIPVFCLFAIVPVAPRIHIFEGYDVGLQVFRPDFGLLYLFGVASLAVYGTSLAGWASNNKLALLGGVRASSQMISYEVALGLSLVGAMMCFGTLRLDTMVELQGSYLWSARLGDFDIGIPRWGLFLQPVGLVLFFAAAFAETKRAPFDMPEGESEIVGYFVEYSGMRFGMFMISEFVEIVVLSAVITSVFLGGWHLGFFGDEWLTAKFAWQNGPLGVDGPQVLACIYGMIFWIKVLMLAWLQLMIRWALPRFRYDQIQKLGWRMLLPIGLLNVFVTGALILWDPSQEWLGVLGIVVLLVLAALAMVKSGGAAPEVAPVHGHDAHGDGGAPTSHAAAH